MSVKTTMTRAEREAFLAGLHVGVISIPDVDRGPLTVPIWYAYEPGGELRLVTEPGSRKGRLLSKGLRVSLCVQTESLPYKYVSVEGPVVAIEPADVERDARALAHRYLGPELGDRYVEATSADRSAGGSVLVRIRPERWLSVDYAKQYSA
jgi:nitroimidazol reductase NimA-like FMN-containing flavoprotein (pyridoxamine 5'-phosphate oxidase superfamily)